MDILELENKHIKIGRTSITVMDSETRKTCGIVRDICKFKDLAANRQIQFSKALRNSGLWGCGIAGVVDAVIIAENQLYYLHNLKPIEAYNKYFANAEGWESEKASMEKRLAIAENMKQYAKVINCYIE